MPELPEVEFAARVARKVAVGRVITRVAVRHPSQRRSLPASRARSLRGDRVTRVERLGKTQRFRLTSGRVLDVHFRMTGDWVVGAIADPVPRFARAILEFDDGGRLVLDDPRALSVLTLSDPGGARDHDLGPDPSRGAFTAERLAAALASRRIPIKVALLDQRLVAGLGNIYAAESLWRAAIDPRAPARTLSRLRVERLVRAIREVLARATRNVRRYYGTGTGDYSAGNRFDVYDREGERCRRCGGRIARIVQAARSTYFCRRCQR